MADVRSAQPEPAGEKDGFRGDIQGLRALAVLLVLFWHARIPGVTGGFVGVDVFFVISGFLITGMLVGRLRRTGRLSLADFYARRVRRLLPAAGVVLAVTLVLTALFLPRLRWTSTAWDVLAANLYSVNWRLAGQATDYLAQGSAPSAVQHYWSLSVEEQFYLVWPLLLILAAFWARRRRQRLGLVLGLTMAAVLVLSLGWSIYLTRVDPNRAYFVTTTRMWELALGGLVAVAMAQLARLPKYAGAALGWLGLGAIAVSALTFSGGTAFPGSAALLPTVGAAAILASGGGSGGRLGPALLFDTAPLRVIGAWSYSIYLWHWPLLVIAQTRFGPLPVPVEMAIAAFSFLPAWLTYRYVENPIRRNRRLQAAPARAFGMAAVVTAVPVGAALIFAQLVGVPPGASPPAVSVVAGTDLRLSEQIGASVLAAEPRNDPRGAPADTSATLRPDPLAVRSDLPDVYAAGCHLTEKETTVKACRYGPADAAYTVALVGDSHAAQWQPALKAIAVARGWGLASYTKSSCPLVDAVLAVGATNRPYTECVQWNRDVLAQLLGPERPDAVVVSSFDYQVVNGTQIVAGDQGRAAYAAGLRSAWQALADAGIPVVVLRDTPKPDQDMGDCVNAHPDRLTRCAFARTPALGGAGPVQLTAAQGLKNVSVIDLDDAICPTDECAAVIGGVIVYRDIHHLTATYALSLAPRLDTALRMAIATPAPIR